MIKIKLCEIMGREKMTRKKLAELTGNVIKLVVSALMKMN